MEEELEEELEEVGAGEELEKVGAGGGVRGGGSWRRS